ncbi:helix-turn-helix domain-containing protein [Marinomonas sp. FW-1]|uniref:helix-turn-helix domain-containing protein n=1 Tax=Marinomonas sp. FW-1 TaxID=2071621 RepID=UPI0010C07EAA|nr:helix-turn-helix domain-containing protein [Marinomonas sp. FW-1]
MLHNSAFEIQPHSPLSFKETVDIEEHAGNMSGWDVRYDQISAGQFAGSITELNLAGMQLIRDKSNQAIIKNGASVPDTIMFTLPLAPVIENLYCEGHVFNPSNLLVSNWQNLPEIKTPANLDVICINAEKQLLQNALDRQNIILDISDTAHCYGLDKIGNQDELLTLLKTVMTPNNTQALLEHEAIRKGIRDTLLQSLLELVNEEEVQYLTSLARKRIVDKARDYVLANINDAPSIVDLCNNVGASRRKLQYCFQETLGINPVTYLRTIRLNSVHRELLMQDSTKQVQNIAAKWGFLHLSRFANDYRQLFGELPSDTLKRNQE